MSSSTMVLTGGTSGIGHLAVVELPRRGAHLVMTARDEKRAAATRAAIEAAVPGARVDFHFADFANLDAVAGVAGKIASRYERIDVLINNAGIHAFEERITADGFAEMVAVNYLAPWLMTNLLRDKLVHSAPTRIVSVASRASRRNGGLTPGRDLLDTAPFSQELAHQLEGTGVAVNCLCPGFNVTGLGRELGFAPLLKRVLEWLNVGDPQRGADIIGRLATHPDFASLPGGYFAVEDTKPLATPSPGDSIASRQDLWSATSALLAHRLAAVARH